MSLVKNSVILLLVMNMKYKILQANSIYDLEVLAAKYIYEGFIPVGGVSCFYNPDYRKNIFYQALIKIMENRQ